MNVKQRHSSPTIHHQDSSGSELDAAEESDEASIVCASQLGHRAWDVHKVD